MTLALILGSFFLIAGGGDDHCDDTCCGTQCYLIDASMAITTDGSFSDEEICEFLLSLQDYTDDFEPGTVQGVEAVGVDLKSVTVDGFKCDGEDTGTDIFIPATVAINEISQGNDNNLYAAVLLPLVAVALLLLAAFLFVKRRRRIRREDEDEERRLRALKDTDYDDLYAYGAGYRQYALNAVNVHKCASTQCSSCSDSRQQTEFLPLGNVSKWIEKRSISMNNEVPGPPPNDELAPLNGVEVEDERNALERSSLAPPSAAEDEAPFDQVRADRLDDQLRGLPTVPEEVDAPMDEMRSKESGSI